MLKVLEMLRKANQNNCFQYKKVMHTVITQPDMTICGRPPKIP